MADQSISTVDRLVATVVNGLEVVKYGGLRVDETPAPYDVVAHQPVYRLRHYFPEAPAGRRPVLLIPPLGQVADVWDISPGTSTVRRLEELGIDPWVVDFGDPATEPGGSERTFTDHVLAVVDAIDRVRDATGHDVHVGGYSQGGIFCYVAAAYRFCEGIASVFTLGSPVTSLVDPDKVVPERLFWSAARAQGKVLRKTGLSRPVVTQMFNWSNPSRTIRNDIQFLLALHDRESLEPREPQRKFLKRGAWVGWAGPALNEVIGVLENNRFVEGGIVVGDRTVGLADLTCPVLIFVGEADHLSPPPTVRKIIDVAPKAEIYEVTLPVGHFGLPVSSHAKLKTWPGVAAWTEWCAGEGELPPFVRRLAAEDVTETSSPRRGLLSSITYGVGIAAETGLALPHGAARAGRAVAASLRDLSVEAAAQASRLARLETMSARTRISYGQMLDDAARTRPDDVAFLFQDRAHTNAASKHRIDSVVRGLVSVGVRKGEHVGVLMDMRPSALVAVAALNRIGAVTVLLRPGVDVAREARLGQVQRLVTDPDNAAVAAELALETFVLGGARQQRDLPESAVDLELIDPDSVTLPAWYRANPGQARELAFIVFSGQGEHTRADRVTHGRWAKSALAASAAAALSPGDTVYSISPLHHPSGLLLSTAAPTAAGARVAMASGFDPETFWAEVRRYGVTVVPYTWTMLHALVATPRRPEEYNHPIRLVVGSGMPSGLWRRVEERFGAPVLELYASTRTDAILGNVSDRKIGAAGRSLPGTPEVRVVRTESQGIATNTDGYAVLCAPGEVGQLLVRVDRDIHGGNDVALRGVFAPDDTWVATGDLFRVDADGDLWFVDSISALLPTAHGVVSPRMIEEALGTIDALDLVACYPHVDDDGSLAARVAVTVRSDRSVDRDVVVGALGALDPEMRPDLVHVVTQMPLTSWFRPSQSALASAGSPASSDILYANC